MCRATVTGKNLDIVKDLRRFGSAVGTSIYRTNHPVGVRVLAHADGLSLAMNLTDYLVLLESPAMRTLALVFFVWLLRVVIVFLRGASAQPSGPKPIRTMAVLGSGGHTAEMLQLLASMDLASYAPRDYVLATTDHTSAQKIEAFESERQQRRGAGPPEHKLLRLPRSREVGQSYATSVLTTLYALVHAVFLVLRRRPSLLLTNGPGTCIPICVVAYALRFLGIKHVTIIYVESIARVQTLSLSGKIMIRFADHFLVQWPSLAALHPRAKYIGRLC